MSTSYLWRGLELNDGINFTVPLAETDFDNKNSASPNYAERKDATPMFLGSTIQSGTIRLPINIFFKNRTELETKMNQLRSRFRPEDSTMYMLERKQAHQSVYRYVFAAVESFEVNPITAQVTVMLHTEDKSWRDMSETVITGRVFDSGYSEQVVVNYQGNESVEPVVKLTSKSATTNSPEPLYWRTVTVYVYDTLQLVETPLKLVHNWDSSSDVSNGYIRSDAADVSVEWLDIGSRIPTAVFGTASARDIWVRPTNVKYITPFKTGETINNSQTTIKFKTDGVLQLPTAGKVCIDSEIISYTGYTVGADSYGKFTGVTRGVDGTTAASHEAGYAIKQPIQFKIRYGYGAGYEQTFTNNLDGWPSLDYDNSTNQSWIMTEAYKPADGQHPIKPFQLGWGQNFYRTPVDGENIYGRTVSPTPGAADDLGLYGNYYPGQIGRAFDRLAMDFTNAKRKPSTLKLECRVQGQVGRKTSLTVSKMLSGYNSAKENKIQWTRFVNNTNSLTSFDTGVVQLYFLAQPFTHLVFELSSPPVSASEALLFAIDKMTFAMDEQYGEYPYAGALGSIQGLPTSAYPVRVGIQNITTGVTKFVVAGNIAINADVVIDCDDRNVTGIPISYVSYQNPIWLRLEPGNNTIEFTAPPGIGEIDYEIRWRNRY